MNKKIIFTNVNEFNLYPPQPAIKNGPKWYINSNEYSTEFGRKKFDSDHPHTIKKCVPVFDMMTMGYILYTQAEVQVFQEDGLPYYSWPKEKTIEFHPLSQAELHPKQNGAPYPKWTNPYSIITPPGYSVLIIPPTHRESVFTIFPGVVDTDKYSAQINFPFVLNNVKWEGIIDAGTPMAQVIPFKRDSWKSFMGSEKENSEVRMSNSKLGSLIFNSYKKQFWSRKEYK
jgi:hypothetical protein